MPKIRKKTASRFHPLIMDKGQKGRRQKIILQLQKQIVKIDHEIEKLEGDKQLYQEKISEINQKELSQSSSSNGISIEIIPEIKEQR
jgi:cell division protein FtsB